MDQQGNAIEPEDYRDDYYCEHGKFVGNPFGGDYMCHFCELGYSAEEYQAYCLSVSAERARTYLKAEVFSTILSWGTIHTFAHCLTTEAWVPQYKALASEVEGLSAEDAIAAERQWRGDGMSLSAKLSA